MSRSTETFSERLARLETLRDLRVGERVRVLGSGRTGTLVSRRSPKRDGWNVRWDEPLFGVEVGRVATSNLERDPAAAAEQSAATEGSTLDVEPSGSANTTPRRRPMATTPKQEKKTTKTAEVEALDAELAKSDEEVLAETAAEVATTAKPKTTAKKTTATKSTTKKAAPKAAAKKAEKPEVELTKPLLDGLAAEGVKASKVMSKTGRYFRLVADVDGKTATLAWVNFRKGGALNVDLRVEGGRTPKGFSPKKTPRNGFGFIGNFETEKEIASAVAGLKLAAEKAAAAPKEAK